jgi:hypothetical protein
MGGMSQAIDLMHVPTLTDDLAHGLIAKMREDGIL